MENLLLSATFGIFWLILLFALCFFAVHVLKLARLGQAYRKERDTPKSEPDEKKALPPQKNEAEPVYYIVERKRRVKSNLGEPKQIKFK